MNTTYIAENASQRERLVALTEKWTAADLAREMPNGWSVATKLAHLAFWDRYYLSLIDGWERAGYQPETLEDGPINEAVRVMSRAIPPAATVELVRAAAEAIDRRLETLSPELEKVLEANGRVRLLRRALHRREHLDQIEEALRGRDER